MLQIRAKKEYGKEVIMMKRLIKNSCMIFILLLAVFGVGFKVSAASDAVTQGVKSFQQYINNNLPSSYLGTPLVVDGSFGSASKTAAIKLIQYRMNQLGAGITVDGGFGSASQQAFLRYVGFINRYDSGDFVYILQGLLYANNYNPGGFDGSYGVSGGTGCLNAVNSFRGTNGILEGNSGTVGLQTMMALLGRSFTQSLPNGNYYTYSMTSNKCMSVSDYINSSGSRLELANITGQNKQKFNITYFGKGTYKINATHVNNKSLATDTSFLYMDDSEFAQDQLWYIYKNGSSYTITNMQYPKKRVCANSSSGTLILDSSVNTGYSWLLGGDDLNTISDNQYAAGVRVGVCYTTFAYDYTIPIEAMLLYNSMDGSDNRCLNWDQYLAWCYDEESMALATHAQHRATQAQSFLWFYSKVKDNGPWDIKRQSKWTTQLPYTPYLGLNAPFMYDGELTDAESLGNFAYGYTGRSTGFGDVTLYWGGGVAAQGSTSSSAVSVPPYYGDSASDHFDIQDGYNAFNAKYPNYPDIGYNGIPVEQGILSAVADALLF